MRDQENKLDELLLDRLVDGELSDAEYRQLLGNLDTHPDGWRRCALAFLEAQAWGREIRTVRHERPAVSAAESHGSKRWSWLYLGTMAIACAASFLLAFGVAMQLQDQPRLSPSNNNLATQQSEALPGEYVPNSNPLFVSNESPGKLNPAELNPSPMGRYQLVVDGESGSPQSVEMPVFAADDPRAGLLLDEYASTPHEIIRALQKGGNDVQRRRNWIPMRAKSGAPLYVPVDEIQVTPVSNRTYQ